MLNPYYAEFLLAVEARKDSELRLVRIAWGGAEGPTEMGSMVGEKVVAAMEAADTLMACGSYSAFIARYREPVADNTHRLMA